MKHADLEKLTNEELDHYVRVQDARDAIRRQHLTRTEYVGLHKARFQSDAGRAYDEATTS